jgi:hypothetical protein
MHEQVPVCTPDTEIQAVAWEGDTLGARRRIETNKQPKETNRQKNKQIK